MRLHSTKLYLGLVLPLLILSAVSLAADDWVCGDVVGEDQQVTVQDLTLLGAHLFLGASLPVPEAANLDGMRGVNYFDMELMVEHLFILSDSVTGCLPLIDSTFPPSNDVISFTNTIVPPGLSRCTVLVFLERPEFFQHVCVPFHWSADDPSVALVGYVSEVEERAIHETEPYGVFTGNFESLWPSATNVALIERIEFSCEPSAVPITISIESSGYPETDHELVLTRRDSDRNLIGQKPTVGPIDMALATGDVDGSGGVDLADAMALVAVISDSVGAPDNISAGDVYADGVIDAADASAMLCYVSEQCAMNPVIPAITLKNVTVVKGVLADTAVGIGGAELHVWKTEEKQGYTVQVDNTTYKGMKYYPRYPQISRSVSAELDHVGMEMDNLGFEIKVTGSIDTGAGGPDYVGQIGFCEIDRHFLYPDYTMIGDSSIFVEVYNSGSLTGSATLYHRELSPVRVGVAGGDPSIDRVQVSMEGSPEITLAFSEACEIRCSQGPTLWGDEVHFSSTNAEYGVSGIYSVDLVAGSLGWFAAEFASEGCCHGLTGNLDGNSDGPVDLWDLTLMIDHLFISHSPMICLEEADVDGSYDGEVTLADLNRLLDVLFISLLPPPPCP